MHVPAAGAARRLQAAGHTGLSRGLHLLGSVQAQDHLLLGWWCPAACLFRRCTRQLVTPSNSLQLFKQSLPGSW